jgi:hypothetical protein
MGAGTQLIDAAKASGIGALELWCFEANERARRFYEARGFHTIRFTDGADNEEQIPTFGIGGKIRRRPTGWPPTGLVDGIGQRDTR